VKETQAIGQEDLDQRQIPKSRTVIRNAFASLAKRPFNVIWALSLLIAMASSSIGRTLDELNLLATLVFALISVYLDMAVILAAGRAEPNPSADVWIRGAFRRRCLIRFVITGLLVDLLVALGILAVVVGAFVVGGFLAVAQPAAVIERQTPINALARSVVLSRGARPVTGVVYALLAFIPMVALQAAYLLELIPNRMISALVAAVAATVGLAGAIALGRLFVVLGGQQTPHQDSLTPVTPQRPA
jgi:hypothetical protein